MELMSNVCLTEGKEIKSTKIVIKKKAKPKQEIVDTPKPKEPDIELANIQQPKDESQGPIVSILQRLEAKINCYKFSTNLP